MTQNLLGGQLFSSSSFLKMELLPLFPNSTLYPKCLVPYFYHLLERSTEHLLLATFQLSMSELLSLFLPQPLGHHLTEPVAPDFIVAFYGTNILYYLLCSVAIAKYNHLGVLNNSSLLSHSPGVQKSRIKVWVAWFLLRTLKEGHVAGPSPQPFSTFLCLLISSFFYTQCVQISSSKKETRQAGIGSTLMAHFNLITSLKTFSPNKVQNVRTSSHKFQEETQLNS